MSGGHAAVGVDVAGVQRNVETEVMTLNITQRYRIVSHHPSTQLIREWRGKIYQSIMARPGSGQK